MHSGGVGGLGFFSFGLDVMLFCCVYYGISLDVSLPLLYVRLDVENVD